MKRGEGELEMGVLFFVVILLLMGGCVGYQIAKPWLAEQSGKAEYAQADQNRRIAILEATAKEESAKHLAQAEIERAKGVAEANRIIGDSLKGNDEYLRYLYVNGLTDNVGANQIIYVPTEAGLPILEASRIK